MMDLPQNPVRIKVCGLTRSDQAVACAGLGADMIGLNCWKYSSRYVSPQTLEKILVAVDGSVETVAVFVNEEAEVVNGLVTELKLDAAQLHGDENPVYTRQLTVPWFKAFRVAEGFRPEIIRDYQSERFLLDAYSKSGYGGFGKTFDWEQAKRALNYGRLILAGGLNPDNIAEAVRKVRPYAVDVCSGVESEPGIKDLHEVERYIRTVKSATAELPGQHGEEGDSSAETFPAS